jgi:hypothetical protein
VGQVAFAEQKLFPMRPSGRECWAAADLLGRQRQLLPVGAAKNSGRLAGFYRVGSDGSWSASRAVGVGLRLGSVAGPRCVACFVAGGRMNAAAGSALFI